MSPNHFLDTPARLKQILCWHKPVKTHYYAYTCPKCGFVSDKPMSGVHIRHIWWWVTNRLPGHIKCLHDWFTFPWFQDMGGIAGESKRCLRCDRLEVWEEGVLTQAVDPLNDVYVGHYPDLVLEGPTPDDHEQDAYKARGFHPDHDNHPDSNCNCPSCR